MKRRLKRVWFWLCWPGLYLYFASRQRSRVVLLDNDGRILLVEGKWKQWFGFDDWGLPGGGLHRREPPADGACRELYEELGVDLRPDQLQKLGTVRVQQHGIGYTAHLWCGRLDAAAPLKLQPGEIVGVHWYTMAELDRMIQKPEVRLARQLLAPHR